MLREPTPMRSNVAEDSTGLAELADTAMLPFGPFFVLPSGWVSLPCGLTLSAQRLLLLHVSHLCESCLGASLAEINQFAGCISPMKLGVCWIFAIVFWKFFLGL